MCIDMDATFDRGSVGAGNVTRTNGLPSRWARLGTWKDLLRPLIHKRTMLLLDACLQQPIHSSTEDATAAEDTESGQASHIFLALLLDGARTLWPSR